MQARPDYTGQVTVPVLWDKRRETIVNNESSDIVRMLNDGFGVLAERHIDLYPAELRVEIDAVNARLYERFNNGVYRAGFATTQAAHERAVHDVFGSLEWIEARLDGHDYLVGDRLTEADVRAFVTLVRFDTGKKLVREQPTSWLTGSGPSLVEHVVARQSNGQLLEFSWRSGQDWRSAPIGKLPGHATGGPASGWSATQGGQSVEHVTAKSASNDLVVFTRKAGGPWTAANLYKLTGRKVAGAPMGWRTSDGRDRIAVTGPNHQLLLFTRGSTGKWTAQDLTAKSGGHKAASRATVWEVKAAQHIAVRAPNDDLLIFREDPIDQTWVVENVTAATGRTISNAPVHWRTSVGAITFAHLAAPSTSGHVLVFSRQGTSAWQTKDVTSATGITAAQPLTAWVNPSGLSDIDHLAAPTFDGRMHVFSRTPLVDWSAVDVSTRSAGRIVQVGSPYADVWRSRDYGVTWRQSARPQPVTSATTVPGALPAITVLDVAVSPVNENLVFAAMDVEGRIGPRPGTPRSRLPRDAGLRERSELLPSQGAWAGRSPMQHPRRLRRGHDQGQVRRR